MDDQACSTGYGLHLQEKTRVHTAEVKELDSGTKWVKLQFGGFPSSEVIIWYDAEQRKALAKAFEKIAQELRLHIPPEPVYFPRLHPVCASVGYPWARSHPLRCQFSYNEGYEAGFEHAKESVRDWYEPEPPERC